MDQDPLGRPGRRVAKDGALEVWAKDMEDGSLAVGLFNRGEEPATVTARWSDLGVSGNQDRPRPVAAERPRHVQGPVPGGRRAPWRCPGARDGGPLRSGIPSQDGVPIAPSRVAMDATREYLVDRAVLAELA